MKYVFSVLFLALLSLPAVAQTPVQGLQQGPVVAAKGAATARPLHVTDRLVASPEGQAALRAFRAAKAAGTLPARKGAAPCTVGQTATFNVLENLVSSNIKWEPRGFECKASNNLASVWVDTTQLGAVPQEDIDALAEALLSKTPPGSFNPDQGIIANDEEVFGDPPNFDGDGVVDVLLYDVTEGPDAAEGTFVLGFFSPTDINPNAGAGQGNQRDVLYLDVDPLITNPGIFGRDETFVQITAAHEYQHLIFANYNPTSNADELTFINEAQSEWAEYLNGYQGRFITYLNDPTRHNIPFLDFGDGGGLIDRQRGSLFHNYLGEQVGVLTTGAITREPRVNDFSDKYVNVLGAESLRNLLANFHTANFLNNTALDPRYGYQRDKLQGIRAVPALVVDGRSSLETPATQFILNKGGVRYVRWEDVGDFTLSLDALPGTVSAETARTWLRPRVVLERTDGTVEVVLVAAQPDPQSFVGPFAAVTLIVPHVELGGIAAPVPIRYAATWTASSAGLAPVTVIQDDGNVHANDPNGTAWIFGTGAGPAGAVANRIEVPVGARILDRVFIAPFFDNQFSNSNQPPGAPRDVDLTIWDDNNGLPGTEIFSLNQNLGSGYFAIDLQTPCVLTSNSSTAPCPISNFWVVDLSAFAEQLSNLPDVIYVGYKESGADQNYIVIVPSIYVTSNVSYVVLNDGNWEQLWNIELNNGARLEQASIPIRVEFLVDTATPVEEAEELPVGVALAPNYPNPFHRVTTIAYRLDRPAEVRLSVFDLLGRRVATLVDGLMPAGRHEAVFDATGQASGLYVYRLETPTRTLARTMVLLR